MTATAFHLTHRYGDVHVIDDVTFTVPPGTLTALLGPTGCGKSTILRIFAGLLTATSGEVAIGDPPAAVTPGHAAYMPQGDTLLPWRSALANATLGLTIQGAGAADAQRRGRELFERFGLMGFESAWPATLSGGMRQRIALLRTVLTGHRLMLLDEPFGALDAITRMDLQGWLGELLQETPRTTLLVTHDIDEALRLADQVLVLSPRPARIVATIPVPDLRPRTTERVTRQDFATLKQRILAALAAAPR